MGVFLRSLLETQVKKKFGVHVNERGVWVNTEPNQMSLNNYCFHYLRTHPIF